MKTKVEEDKKSPSKDSKISSLAGWLSSPIRS